MRKEVVIKVAELTAAWHVKIAGAEAILELTEGAEFIESTVNAVAGAHATGPTGWNKCHGCIDGEPCGHLFCSCFAARPAPPREAG
jgi:hypothetical protein